jgi:hypothetical protein
MDLKALEEKMRDLNPENGDWEGSMSIAVDLMYTALEELATNHIVVPDGRNRSQILELLDAFDDNFR